MATNHVYEEFLQKLNADLEQIISLLVGVIGIDNVGKKIDEIMSNLNM